MHSHLLYPVKQASSKESPTQTHTKSHTHTGKATHSVSHAIVVSMKAESEDKALTEFVAKTGQYR